MRTQLWRDAAEASVYVVLDGAQNPTLLDVFFEHPDLGHECLMGGVLEPDMQEVAPYVVALPEEHPFTEWLLAQGWAQNWGVFAISPGDLGDVWRHLRRTFRVQSPEGEVLYFRFYDPRVLRAFLPTCDTGQLKEFFGPVRHFLCEDEAGQGALLYSLAEDGTLVTQAVAGKGA
ncbi:hypothetical protein ISF6_0355 [Piscinibacter sakaiensis]|uniref:DUF4123 domain-containing protein n=1 Tax=Piscinibacter sakaiensis TaxID=1547922 RepID=A0A0K8NWU4_PISS1|nr:hypothetical protein ISF6_0355 [Piscinibacter sakaiensis]